jgi:tetratricopeptide (TPR) repeat protein
VSYHSSLGDTLKENGDLDGAIAAYRQVTALLPKEAWVHDRLGNALKDKGELDGAIAEYRLAIKVDPKYAAARSNLGNALRDKGDLDGAFAEYRRAIQLDPKNVFPHFQLAEALLGTGEVKAAAAESRKALELTTSDDPNPWFYHACMLVLAGDAKGYRKVCARMVARFGQARDAYTGHCVARVCSLAPEGVPDFARAVQLAEKAAAGQRNAYHVHALALAQYRAGRFDQAVRFCRESLKIHPNWQGVFCNWLVLAMAHHRLGQTKEAEQWLNKAGQWMDGKGLKKGQEYVGPLFGIHPADWLEGRVLRREAEGLIKGTGKGQPRKESKNSK